MTPRRLTAMALCSRRPRPTVRLRLTLWYSGLFLVSGATLLGVTYALVAQATEGAVPSGIEVPVGLSRQQAQALTAREHAAALSAHASVLHEFVSRSALALALLAVLSIALGWIVAGRVLRPLRTISAAAREISAASLGQRLALGGPDDELKELGDTFDGLLARLQASFCAQRQFIANASHELRTPLARQRVISQVALADPGATIETLKTAHERVLASGAQQQQLIEALLMLARGQAGLDTWEPFDLATVTGEVLAARRSEVQYRNLALNAALGPAPASGNLRLTERLAANLVDNALRHNAPGGRVNVITGLRNSRAVLSVANTGPAVPAGALDRLFQPFQRLGTDRTSRGVGLGLGLSIVQAIADAHNASISARPQSGGGLLVEVTFPHPDPDQVNRPKPGPSYPSADRSTSLPTSRHQHTRQNWPIDIQ
jgi:signal transduction histidine kinase